MPRPSVAYEESIALIQAGKSNTEISTALGLPPGTVRSRRSRHLKGGQVQIKNTANRAILGQEKNISNDSVATVPSDLKSIKANLATQREYLKAIDGGQSNQLLIQLPTFDEIKREIWKTVLLLEGHPKHRVAGFNCYLRALDMEASLGLNISSRNDQTPVQQNSNSQYEISASISRDFKLQALNHKR